ncbi:MAG: phage holin family protein [Salegentibacter sp.]
MAFEKVTNSINELNENIQAFAQSNAEYYKLQFFKQATKGASALVKFALLGLFGLLAIVILSVALSIWISQEIGVPSSGFFIVGGFYLLLCILVLIFGKKPIDKLLLVKLSRAFFND